MPQTLYHYTGQNGLLGIFESKSLWVSSVRHLNDAAELQYAADLARKLLKDKNLVSPARYYEDCMASLDLLEQHIAFVGSFSADGGDRLSQWRAYSHNGVGYSIGFNLDRLKTLATRQGSRLVECTYDTADHEQMLKGLIATAEEGLIARSYSPAVQFFIAFMGIAPTMKHPSFKDEQEWRLIGEQHYDEYDAKVVTKLRHGKSLLIPYRTLSLTEDGGGSPITEVVVGPSPHMSLSVETLHIFGTQMVGNIRVRESAVPYRDW